MKKRMILLAVIGLLLNSSAIADPLSEPLSSTTPDNTRYLNKPDLLKPCTGRVAAFKGQPCDIIFIGDSITELWLRPGKEIWDKMYAPRHALDFGIGGDKTQNVLWRLENMDVKDLKPKVAVVLIGTNNGKNKAQEIADGVKAVLGKTQATFPGAKIILVSIMPSKRGLKLMNEVDAIIKDYADGKTIYWLDLVPLMSSIPYTTTDGKTGMTWKGIGTRDLLHPDADGYQIWSDAMEPLLSKLLAGDTK
jgi:lysophospholipase L1-like esterase